MGIITLWQHLPPNMVGGVVVVNCVKAVAVEGVAVVDTRVLWAVDAVEAADTKGGDVAAVGRERPLAASMVLMYQTAIITPMNLKNGK